MTAMTQTSHTAVARALSLLLAGSLSLLATACAAPPPPPATAPAPASASAAPAAPDAGQPLTLTLQGRLVLRGNAPHEQPVLQTASGETWQLKGLNAEQVTQWQRQNVEVRGQPGPRPAAGAAPSMAPPQLQVQSIRAQP
ncbi:hypothetical protein CTI10_027030 [Delftia acidovorans]|uniref:Uncharacterized protein n=1 Tax=Chryseobacterium sp. B5 TaxID=2050562 RepID=A0A2G7T3F0_9FLAO|nr:hypothetical protein CTI10_027030 [Delftia acidovorans]